MAKVYAVAFNNVNKNGVYLLSLPKISKKRAVASQARSAQGKLRPGTKHRSAPDVGRNLTALVRHMHRRRRSQPPERLLTTHEVRARPLLDTEHRPLNVEKTGDLHAERRTITVAELDLGSDKRGQDLVNIHLCRVCGATGDMRHKHERSDLLQPDRATDVGAHRHTNRHFSTTIVTIQVERRRRGDGKRTTVQLQPVHPAVNGISQVGGVVPLLITVATSANDDAIRGAHQMALDALKNTCGLHLTQPRCRS